ncbi:MAG: hypothetical protein HLUCCA09_02295 [Rhodobacteraceae bacterium HLUCCA09]|nr:MAG: hypothetical protein HLUCCA09_02295 [Rhodobacteraceae bacterium HLUCCA09]
MTAMSDGGAAPAARSGRLPRSIWAKMMGGRGALPSIDALRARGGGRPAVAWGAGRRAPSAAPEPERMSVPRAVPRRREPAPGPTEGGAATPRAEAGAPPACLRTGRGVA